MCFHKQAWTALRDGCAPRLHQLVICQSAPMPPKQVLFWPACKVLTSLVIDIDKLSDDLTGTCRCLPQLLELHLMNSHAQPQPPRHNLHLEQLAALTSLEMLQIDWCTIGGQDVKTNWPKLGIVMLANCALVEDLQDWILHMPQLRVLRVRDMLQGGASTHRPFWQNVARLPQLRTLGCDGMLAYPADWWGDLAMCRSLGRLELVDIEIQQDNEEGTPTVDQVIQTLEQLSNLVHLVLKSVRPPIAPRVLSRLQRLESLGLTDKVLPLVQLERDNVRVHRVQ